MIECWCGAPYVKSQWKYHISSEQHCENYKKMRRIGYIPFKEYRLTAPIHNESPRLHGATLRPMHDRIRLYNMMDNYFCTEICNAVNSNPNRFNGPVMKSLISIPSLIQPMNSSVEKFSAFFKWAIKPSLVQLLTLKVTSTNWIISLIFRTQFSLLWEAWANNRCFLSSRE